MEDGPLLGPKGPEGLREGTVPGSDSGWTYKEDGALPCLRVRGPYSYVYGNPSKETDGVRIRKDSFLLTV